MQVCQPVQSVTYYSKEEKNKTWQQEIICSSANSDSPKKLLLTPPTIFSMKKGMTAHRFVKLQILWDKHQHLTPNQVCSLYIQYQENAYKVWCQPETFSVILSE